MSDVPVREVGEAPPPAPGVNNGAIVELSQQAYQPYMINTGTINREQDVATIVFTNAYDSDPSSQISLPGSMQAMDSYQSRDFRGNNQQLLEFSMPDEVPQYTSAAVAQAQCDSTCDVPAPPPPPPPQQECDNPLVIPPPPMPPALARDCVPPAPPPIPGPVDCPPPVMPPPPEPVECPPPVMPPPPEPVECPPPVVPPPPEPIDCSPPVLPPPPEPVDCLPPAPPAPPLPDDHCVPPTDYYCPAPQVPPIWCQPAPVNWNCRPMPDCQEPSDYSPDFCVPSDVPGGAMDLRQLVSMMVQVLMYMMRDGQTDRSMSPILLQLMLRFLSRFRQEQRQDDAQNQTQAQYEGPIGGGNYRTCG